MSTHINIRLDDETVAALDELAVREGSTRAELVRAAVLRLLRAKERLAVASAYRAAYGEHPETGGELRRAQRSAGRLTAEEPWERWW